MWTADEHKQLNEAVTEFNRGEYFACHETLETLWKQQSDELKRRWLQGILQISVGFHHLQKGNQAGAMSILEKGLRNLMVPLHHEDFRVLNIDIDRLTDETLVLFDELKNGGQLPTELPSIYVCVEEDALN